MEFDISKPPGSSWGIRIGGGVDRGKVLVIEKVKDQRKVMSIFFLFLKKDTYFMQIIFNSIAYENGLKDRDYIVEINGNKVFEISHDECKDLIRKAGDHMMIKIER